MCQVLCSLASSVHTISPHSMIWGERELLNSPQVRFTAQVELHSYLGLTR